MGMEPERLADRGDMPEPEERRARVERRGPDRRGADRRDHQAALPKRRSATTAFHPDQDPEHLVPVSTKPGSVQQACRDGVSRRMGEARSGCFPTDAW